MIQFNPIKDTLDIFLVACILYMVFKLLKRSSAANVFYGMLIFIVVWLVVTQFFNMRLLGAMLDYCINVGAIGLVVIFADELRRFLFTLGTNRTRLWGFLRSKKAETTRTDVLPIVMACMSMSRKKVGALIVMTRQDGLAEYEASGEAIDASVSQRLIENIFFKNSPLHDGAMIIRNRRISAAACIMPVSHDADIPKALGLRHRAAMGIAQKTDALAIIVSEETGDISVAFAGKFRLNLTPDELENILCRPDSLLDE